MPTYEITSRKTSPIETTTVEAETRELAIEQVVNSAAEGEQIEVTQVVDVSAGAAAEPAEG